MNNSNACDKTKAEIEAMKKARLNAVKSQKIVKK